MSIPDDAAHQALAMVEELRETARFSCPEEGSELFVAAADMIERVTAALVAERTRADQALAAYKADIPRWAAVRAELRTLQAERDRLQQVVDAVRALCDKADAETQRFLAENPDAQARIDALPAKVHIEAGLGTVSVRAALAALGSATPAPGWVEFVDHDENAWDHPAPVEAPEEAP